MGKGRRKRHRRARRKKLSAAPVVPSGRRSIELAIEAVELARGFDGFLRGAPEPCLLLSTYLVRAGSVQPLGRVLERLRPGPTFPQRLVLDKSVLCARTFPSSASESPGLLVVVAVALEEDSGKDVAALYGDLGRPARLSLWDPTAELPEPRALEELVQLAPSIVPEADRISLLRDGVALEQAVTQDDWVGSLLLRVSLVERTQQSYRFHFVSPDEKNDWTLSLGVRVR